MANTELKNKFKRLANWIIPMYPQRLLITCWRKLQRSLVIDKEVKYKIKSNIEYKNKHKGEEVFILCTGSSINNYDLLRLKGKKCIAVSFFSLHKHYRELAPDYHIFAPNHPPLDFEHAENMFTAFKNNECPNTTVFLGHMDYQYSYLNYLRNHPELRPDNLEFICYDGSPSLNDENYLNDSIWNIATRPFIMGSVLYGAFQLAAYLGFKRVYLLGADHDYMETVNKATNHFYKQVDDAEVNLRPKMNLELAFHYYYMAFHNYSLINDYCKSKDIKVINLSEESKLDMFEKQDFNKLFS